MPGETSPVTIDWKVTGMTESHMTETKGVVAELYRRLDTTSLGERIGRMEVFLQEGWRPGCYMIFPADVDTRDSDAGLLEVYGQVGDMQVSPEFRPLLWNFYHRTESAEDLEERGLLVAVATRFSPP